MLGYAKQQNYEILEVLDRLKKGMIASFLKDSSLYEH